MSAPLSKNQQRYLAMQSARAFELARERGEAVLDCGCQESQETSFRHNLVLTACGRHGLCCCGQDDYLRVKAYLLHLLGDDGAAFEAHLRAESEPRRLAEYKLKEALREFDLPWDYAQAICRRQNHGLGMADVGPNTLWNIVFTIRNRSRRKRAA